MFLVINLYLTENKVDGKLDDIFFTESLSWQLTSWTQKYCDSVTLITNRIPTIWTHYISSRVTIVHINCIQISIQSTGGNNYSISQSDYAVLVGNIFLRSSSSSSSARRVTNVKHNWKSASCVRRPPDDNLCDSGGEWICTNGPKKATTQRGFIFRRLYSDASCGVWPCRHSASGSSSRVGIVSDLQRPPAGSHERNGA